MSTQDLPLPEEGMYLTHLLIVEDVERSKAFYRDVVGATVVFDAKPCIMRLANGWIMINEGGGPTPDKPDVVMSAPRDPKVVSSCLNFRVADIKTTYEEMKARGGEFVTPPVEYPWETRCYLRDPDGHLIEIGQTVAEALTAEPPAA